jgi:hypothetical protein
MVSAININWSAFYKKFKLIIYIPGLLALQANAQSDFKFIGKLEIVCTQFTIDPLGNIYIINGLNIQKYNKDLQKIADYSNAFLGNISFIDASDPLRILLYYREFNQAVWLDNFFQEIRSPVLLDDLGVEQAMLICSSSMNGFWIFNQLNNQLQYFDNNLNKIHESIRLNPLTGEEKPVAMTEKNRMVYLNFPGTGILTFDQFGTYSRTLPIFPDLYFQVTDESILYLQKDTFKRYDLKTYKEEIIKLPETENINSVMIRADNLFILEMDGILIYKISSNNI